MKTILTTIVFSVLLTGCSMLNTPVTTTSKIAPNNIDMTSNVVYANLWSVPTSENTEVEHDA
jgi:hypothetical protein